jgi:DNA-binding transcriptional LysR family regulator
MIEGPMLSTTRLRILREVASLGSAAAAARALYLTPPAVTYQLAALEREVGVPLLERTACSIRLTAAGLRLVEHTDTILADCELALADVRALSDEVCGTVRLSVFRAAVGGVSLAALLELRREYPDLEVLTSDLEPDRAVSALKANQIDIALAFEWSLAPRPQDPSVDRHALFTEDMAMLVPVGHHLASSPVRLGDLADEAWCVAQDEEHGRGVLERVARSNGLEPRVVFESDSFRAIGSAVEAGLGIGLVPLMTDLRGLDVVIKPLAEPRLSRRVFAAVRRGSGKSPAIGAVLDALSTPACAVRTSTLRSALKRAVLESTDVLEALRAPSAEDDSPEGPPTGTGLAG